MRQSLCLLALSLSLAVRADIICQWNFNSVPADADTGTGTTVPSIGTGSASIVGGVSPTYVTGDSSHDPAGNTDNSAWRTTAYPGVTNANKSAGVRFDVDTSSYENITVS